MSYLGYPTGDQMPFAPGKGGIGSGTAGIDPAVARGLQAGRQMHWTEAQSAVNDATARLGNAYMGEGIPDASMAMPYLMRANEKGRDFQVAVNARDAEIHRLGMVAADPRGADLYARFEVGEIPGYQITGDPGVSPYWKKLVVERSMRERKDPAIYGRAQLPGSSSRAGMAPTALADEALGQMMRAADRMSNGRGGAALRRAVASYAAALAGGDETTINSAKSMLSGMLGGMMSRFQDRVDKESGVAGMVDVKKQFFRELDARIAGRSAGAASSEVSARGGRQTSPTTSPPVAAGTQGPAANAGRSGSPGRPTLAPNGMRVHEFATRDHFLEEVDKGRVVGDGELVAIGGRPYVAVPGRDSQDLVPAMVFGSTAIPDPGLYGAGDKGVRAWSSTLSDEQRQAVLADLTANPETRAGLSVQTLNDLNMVVRSRQGLLNSRMSPRDREAAAAKLRNDEDAAIRAAIVGMVGSRGSTNARTLAAMQEESRQDAADDKARNAADEKLSGDAPPTQESQRPLGGDDRTDGLGSQEDPKADEMVVRSWQSMQPSLRREVDGMLSVLSTMEFTADPASKDQPDMTLLSNMEMRRLLVQASRGATEMELVSMMDRMRPGFAAAYYGPTSQSATDLASEWAKFSHTPMVDEQSLMKLWSFLTLFEATGQWPEQSMRQHWQDLPDSAKASAAAYASHARRAAATPQQAETRPAATQQQQQQQQSAPTQQPASTPQTGPSRQDSTRPTDPSPQSLAASTPPTPAQTSRNAARLAASAVSDPVSQYVRTGMKGGIAFAEQVAMALMEGSIVVEDELRDLVNRAIENLVGPDSPLVTGKASTGTASGPPQEIEFVGPPDPPFDAYAAPHFTSNAPDRPEPSRTEPDPEGAARFNLGRPTNLVGPDSPLVTGKASTGTASGPPQASGRRRSAAPSPPPQEQVLTDGDAGAGYDAAVSEQVDRWRRMAKEEKLRFAEEIARMVVELERLNMRRR